VINLLFTDGRYPHRANLQMYEPLSKSYDFDAEYRKKLLLATSQLGAMRRTATDGQIIDSSIDGISSVDNSFAGT